MNIFSQPLSRREAMRRIVTAAAAMHVLQGDVFAQDPVVRNTIGTDPNLHTKVIPWDRVLTEAELRTAAVLADTIIPADDKGPAASAVGVPDFINEWVSAPYPMQQADGKQVREGFAWLDEEAKKRFGKIFAELDEKQITAICDDICFSPKAKPEFKKAASFFSKYRNLVAGGYYSTPEGWKDIGYIGNVPMAEFPGPPPEVLKHVGLI